MKIKLKKLSDQVIVITGASSGIGLATARMAAKQGARVVVAARGDEPIQQLAEELTSAGGQAVGIATDVSRQQDVRNLAHAAVQRFGRIDTWVNNAGASVYGQILDVPVDEERKLFETNYWGLVYGSRTAVEHLRKSGGALINLGSVASDVAIPLQSSYSASKHAVKAFTDALRMELDKEQIPISVTLIKPTAIDTPFFHHAKTYMDAQPTEPSPMYAPEEVANAILHAAQNPIRDVLVGDIAPLQSAMGRYFPSVADKFMGMTMFDGQKSGRQPSPGDNAGLDRASGDLRERGGFEGYVAEKSLYTRASLHPLLTGAVAAGAGLALALMISNSRRETPVYE